ncbi:MAG: hypothetical protein WKF41_13950 [Gaiellaceae bacterium]
MSRFNPILAGLRSADHEAQREAEDALRELRPLTLDEAAQALRAAAEGLPPRENDWEDSASHLVLAAVTGASEELIVVVQEIYTRLPTPFSRTAALRLLANLDSRDAYAVLGLLLASPPDPREDLDAIWWETEPRHGDLLCPALITRLANDLSRASVFDVVLRLAATEEIAPEHAVLLAPAALAELRRLRRRASTRFEWAGRDLDQRLERCHRAERALTMLGAAPASTEAITELAAWAGLDSLPAAAALTSLLRLGQEAEPSEVARVAADPEARRRLFNDLSQLDRMQLMPSRYRTQEALAEAALVEWLTFPGELGRPPTAIEFVELISADTDEGPVDLYVFRFRAEGGRLRRGKWFAGVAGPYRREDSPTITGGEMTFSAFEPWDERSPLDHAELVAEILESWRRADGNRSDGPRDM